MNIVRKVKKEIKRRDRAINNLLKSAKVPANASKEERDNKILDYIAKKGEHKYGFSLTDEQLKDADFLLKLYNADESSVIYCIPDIGEEEIQNNTEFMIHFVKKYLDYKQKIRLKEYTQFDFGYELKFLIKNYKHAMCNPEFVENLARRYPEVNIIELVNDSLNDGVYGEEDKKKAREQCFNIYRNLPKEIILDNIKNFRVNNTLCYLPKDLPYFEEAISAGIEREGFKALNYLSADKVPDNMPLVIKAYKKDGCSKLVEYIYTTLNPEQYEPCSCGCGMTYNYHKEYEKTQKDLINNEEIINIIKTDLLKIKEKSSTNKIQTNTDREQ